MSTSDKKANRTSKFDFSQSAPTHFTCETEIAAYVNWINTQLLQDADLVNVLPISTTKPNALFDACGDGILLCKLVNNSVPGTIPEKKIIKTVKTVIHKFENNQSALAGAVKIGVHVHNLSAEDIMKGTPHLVLGLVWQVIKIGLLQNVATCGTESANTSANDIVSKAEPTTQSLEKALLKWVNATLKKQNLQLRVTNFGSDLSDSVALSHLISIFDENANEPQRILQEPDLSKRAELVLDYAQKFDCRHFASAADIVGGNKNLNLAFVAVLHNLKVSRDKAQEVRIQLEGAKDTAEAALLRVHSSKELETKKLRLQLDDAKEEIERLRNDRDNLQNDLEALRAQAEEQEAVYEENNQLINTLADVQKELEQSRQVNEHVSARVESLADSCSHALNSKKDLLDKLEQQSSQIQELKLALDFSRQQVKELQESNAQLKQQLLDLSAAGSSYLSLNDLSCAPANSLNNLSNNQQPDLAQQLAESQQLALKLQYQLLEFQALSGEKSQQLELAVERAEKAEQQANTSNESLAQLFANAKQQLGSANNNNSTDFEKRQQELILSIDTLNEEVLALQLMNRDDPEREKLLQDQIRQMQQLTILLVAQANLNEAEVVERVFFDLRKQQGDVFGQLQLKDSSHKDLVAALSEFVNQLKRKAVDSEKKVQTLTKSIDTLHLELQEQKLQQQPSQQQEETFRDADIDENDSKARKQMFHALDSEKQKLQDRLAVLHRTTAAIMEQRSILISENNKLMNNESLEHIHLSRQIKSLDSLLAENLKIRQEIEEGNEEFFNSTANLEELAIQQIKVQTQVDAMVRSEDCLIEDLNQMKETNQELQEKLENSQRCIAALMAQRSILLKDRDELKEQLTVARSQQSLAQSNEQLSRTKHNNSFASAPNLAKK
ncbi:hypothetical protein HDU98_010425 [Podochytrium sp. JEL0797]|nr:hypothetical protein HDU98_010425 [Podochytrium sp. JEL0797]